MKRLGLKNVVERISVMIRGGILYIFTGSLLTKLISMISSIVVARIVEKTEYAQLAYADNMYGYIALASGLGLSTAILNFVPIAKNRKERQSYLRYALKVGGIFDLFIVGFLCIGVSVAELPFEQARGYIYMMAVYPVCTHFINVFQCYLRAMIKNREYAIIGILQAGVVCGCSIVLGLLMDVKGIIVSRYIAAIVVIIFAFWVIKREEGIDVGTTLSKYAKKEMCTLGISLMLANFFSGMMPLNEVFLINHIIQDEVVTSNFKVAGLIPTQLFLVTGALAVYFFPRIVQMENKKEIKSVICKIGILNLGLILLCTGIGMIITPYMIHILYGNKYKDSIPISYMLWIIRGINAGARLIPMNFLPAIGGARFNAKLAAISVVIQVITDIYFLKKFGIFGIIIGSTLVYTFSAIAYWLYLFHLCREENKDVIST